MLCRVMYFYILYTIGTVFCVEPAKLLLFIYTFYSFRIFKITLIKFRIYKLQYMKKFIQI
jgi:hypothetical protein